MNRLLFTLVCATLVCGAWMAQAQPRFEVASSKPSKAEPPFRVGMKVSPGGRVSIQNFWVMMLIATAYDVPFQSKRLTGGPDWIRGEIYNIEATVPEGAVPPNATARQRDLAVRQMLQGLLADRFKLVLTKEVKEQPIYAITVSKKGLKLEKAGLDEKDCPIDGSGSKTTCHDLHGGHGTRSESGIHGTAATIEDVATFVSNWSDRPVFDQTGIKTLFKFNTPGWIPMQPIAAGGPPTSAEGLDDPTRPTLFTIFNQMGLKLEARKGPVESFIVQSIERPMEQ